MKKKINTSICLMIFMIGGVACSTATPTPKNTGINSSALEVYANPACPHCQALTKKLEEENISFVYYNIVDNPENKTRLWTLLKKYKPAIDSVLLPVVYINKQILLRPGFVELKKIIQSGDR